MILSLMVLTTPRRRNNFCQVLLEELEKQIASTGRTDIEILCLYDNKKRNVGAKRNAIVSIASGEYLCFLDDDDMVTPDYLQEILKALETKPDVVVFDVICSGYTTQSLHCTYSKDFAYASNYDERWWRGKPAHIHVFKARFFKENCFPEINNGEDMEWVKKVSPQLVTEVQINKVLYHYNFDVTVSEVAGR